MQNTTTEMRYVGLDVSKDKIAVGIAEPGREKALFYGTISNTPDQVRRLVSTLASRGPISVCYEAGPTGYGIYREVSAMEIPCIVVAPSLIPQRSGDRVKTDRRDALRLAELFRAGELTAVWVPGPQDEVLRDLVRAREDAVEDRLRARHRLSKFLLRHSLFPSGPKPVRNWTVAHRAWLDSLKLEGNLGVVFREYLHTLDEIQGRIDRFEAAIHEASTTSTRAPVIQALQTMRGIKEVAAASIVAEVGEFSRFRHPGQLMAYSGLVPSEYSSGLSQRRGGITKAGDPHLRRIAVESAWSYRHQPNVSAALRKRQENQSADVRDIAWKAQIRLHNKYTRLMFKGKGGGVTTAAVARELLGFTWAIGCLVEAKIREQQPKPALPPGAFASEPPSAVSSSKAAGM